MPEHDAPIDKTNLAPPRPKMEPFESNRTGLWFEQGPAEKPSQIGRFVIRDVLGKGAFGIVYREYDPQLHREVAIKVPLDKRMSPERLEAFRREASAAAAIHHQHICPVYEVGIEGKLPYIISHLVVGPTLAKLLEQRKTPFPTQHAAAIVRKLAMGVAAAHAQHVTHRDLKPVNVLVDNVSNDVLITDFGLALLANETRASIDGTVKGRPAYRSPEQARGEVNAIGPLSDVTLSVSSSTTL